MLASPRAMSNRYFCLGCPNFDAVESWLEFCRVMRGGDCLDPVIEPKRSAMQVFFAASTGTAVGAARADVPMGRHLPSEDDEASLEFLHDCSYDIDKASLLLASIAGGGQEVSALRHIEAARSHALGGKVSMTRHQGSRTSLRAALQAKRPTRRHGGRGANSAGPALSAPSPPLKQALQLQGPPSPCPQCGCS